MTENDPKSHENLVSRLKSIGRRRSEIACYSTLKKIINQKKYKQKCIKLEEFIDDVYANDAQQFKTMIQTRARYSNLVDDFLQFIYFLVK